MLIFARTISRDIQSALGCPGVRRNVSKCDEQSRYDDVYTPHKEQEQRGSRNYLGISLVSSPKDDRIRGACFHTEEKS